MNPVRVPWTSASFLLYAGGLVVLASAVWLLGELSNDYAEAAFVGWSLLVLAFLAACAFSFRMAGRSVVAGLFAVSTVAAFAVFVGALEDWFGWLPDNASPFSGFHVGLLLLELLTLVAALWALRVFRFPLLVFAAAAAGWYFVLDLISGGGDWSAIVSIAVGLVLLVMGLAADRVYGFWLHVASGLAIGGGLLWFWHTSDTDWVLVALVGLVYVWMGGAIERSSWVVLGAVGLFLSTTHWVDKWFGLGDFVPFVTLGDGGGDHPWARAVSYGVLGFVFLALGLLLQRRRRESLPA